MDADVKKKILIGIAVVGGALLIAALGWFLFFISQFATYNDKTYRFSIKYPSRWRVVVAPQPGAAVVFVSPPETALDTFRENVSVTVQYVPPELATLKSFSNKVISQMTAVFGDIKVAESRPVDFGKHKGYRVLFTAEKPNKMHILNVWTIKEGAMAYILTFISADNRFEKYSPLIEEMIRSFEVRP